MVQIPTEFFSTGICLRENIASWPSAGLDNHFIPITQPPLLCPCCLPPCSSMQHISKTKNKQHWNFFIPATYQDTLRRQLLAQGQFPSVLIPMHSFFFFSSPIVGLDIGVHSLSSQVILAPFKTSTTLQQMWDPQALLPSEPQGRNPGYTEPDIMSF